jgi:hypothetical protein
VEEEHVEEIDTTPMQVPSEEKWTPKDDDDLLDLVLALRAFGERDAVPDQKSDLELPAWLQKDLSTAGNRRHIDHHFHHAVRVQTCGAKRVERDATHKQDEESEIPPPRELFYRPHEGRYGGLELLRSRGRPTTRFLYRSVQIREWHSFPKREVTDPMVTHGHEVRTGESIALHYAPQMCPTIWSRHLKEAKLKTAMELVVEAAKEFDRLCLAEVEQREEASRRSLDREQEEAMQAITATFSLRPFSATFGPHIGPSWAMHFGRDKETERAYPRAMLNLLDSAYECCEEGLAMVRSAHTLPFVYSAAEPLSGLKGYYQRDRKGRAHAACAPLESVDWIDFGRYRFRVELLGFTFAHDQWFRIGRLVILDSFLFKRERFVAIHRRAELPNVIKGPQQAKSTALFDFAGMAKRMPENLQYTVNIARQQFAANDFPSGFSAREFVETAVARDKIHESQMDTVGFAPFVLRRKTPKSCYGCGVEPSGRYRWKHRMCPSCAKRKFGAATQAGRLVANGYDPGTCTTGTVHVPGSERPPKLKKWASVKLEKKDITIPGSWIGSPERRVAFTKDMLPLVWRFQPQDNGRERVRLNGIGISGANVMVSANTRFNQLKALAGRAFLAREVKPTQTAWNKAEELLPVLLPIPFDRPPMKVEDWIRSMPSRRRKPLEQAAKRYALNGLTKKDLMFKSFVKAEKLPDFAKLKDTDILMPMAPLTPQTSAGVEDGMIDRLINGPEEVAHVVAGPALKPQLGALKEQWHWEHALFYAAVGPELLTKWLNRVATEGKMPVWCDMSMMDRSHSTLSWDFMERRYRQIPGLSADFWTVLKAWRRPKGTMGPIRFQAHTMNASGRDDTSLANGVLNGIVLLLSLAACINHCEIDQLTEAMVVRCMQIVDIAVAGDDSLCWIPLRQESELAQLKKDMQRHIASFGFVAKLECSLCKWKAVFLGMRPLPVGDHLEWTKTAGRALYKLGWMLDPVGDGAAWAHGVCDATARCFANTPILREVCLKYCQLREGAKKTPIRGDENRPWDFLASNYTSGAWDSTTLSSFCEAYSDADMGITLTPESVRDCIAEVDRLSAVPAVVNHWVLRWLVHYDDL